MEGGTCEGGGGHQEGEGGGAEEEDHPARHKEGGERGKSSNKGRGKERDTGSLREGDYGKAGRTHFRRRSQPLISLFIFRFSLFTFLCPPSLNPIPAPLSRRVRAPVPLQKRA